MDSKQPCRFEGNELGPNVTESQDEPKHLRTPNCCGVCARCKETETEVDLASDREPVEALGPELPDTWALADGDEDLLPAQGDFWIEADDLE